MTMASVSDSMASSWEGNWVVYPLMMLFDVRASLSLYKLSLRMLALALDSIMNVTYEFTKNQQMV